LYFEESTDILHRSVDNRE